MKIVHRVAVAPSDAQFRALSSHGLELNKDKSGYVVFYVDDADVEWPMVSALLTQWGITEMASAQFTKRELAEAACLTMCPRWHHGYPQPENDFKEVTYDSAEYCPTCGVGLKQQAPFRMLREPKWGSRQILQLNWVFDEYFATPEAWQQVFAPLGVASLPVLHHKTGRPLKSVVQLSMTAQTASKIAAGAMDAWCCPVCKRVKLRQRKPGFFPNVELPAGVHIAKTREYVGALEASPIAWHEVVVSNALYKAITAEKLKGVSFKAVAN